MNEPIWEKWECGGGARWTSVKNRDGYENLAGTTCNFSGCNCETKVVSRGVTSDRNTAHNWFKLPVKNLK